MATDRRFSARRRIVLHVALSDFLSRLRTARLPRVTARPSAARAMPTKALAQFLARPERPGSSRCCWISGRSSAAIVTFFGEQLGCKISVEDLAKDIDRHVREDTVGALPGFFEKRFPQAGRQLRRHHLLGHLRLPREAGGADAGRAGRAPAPARRRRAGVLQPLGSRLRGRPTYTRHVVVDPRTLEHRTLSGGARQAEPLPNRDLQRLFEPLDITDQFLLKTNLREVVFRKPVASPVHGTGAAP